LRVATTSNVKREQKSNQNLDTVSQLHELLKKIQNGLQYLQFFFLAASAALLSNDVDFVMVLLRGFCGF
jgi:hypothetical protein